MKKIMIFIIKCYVLIISFICFPFWLTVSAMHPNKFDAIIDSITEGK